MNGMQPILDRRRKTDNTNQTSPPKTPSLFALDIQPSTTNPANAMGHVLIVFVNSDASLWDTEYRELGDGRRTQVRLSLRNIDRAPIIERARPICLG